MQPGNTGHRIGRHIPYIARVYAYFLRNEPLLRARTLRLFNCRGAFFTRARGFARPFADEGRKEGRKEEVENEEEPKSEPGNLSISSSKLDASDASEVIYGR